MKARTFLSVALAALVTTTAALTTADAKVKSKGSAVTVTSRDDGGIVGYREYKTWREGDVIHFVAWLTGDAARSSEADHDKAWILFKGSDDRFVGRKVAPHVFRFDYPVPRDREPLLHYFEGRRSGKVSWPWPPKGPGYWETPNCKSDCEFGVMLEYPSSGQPVARGN